MKSLKTTILIGCCLIALSPASLVAQSVANASFEDPITYDGAPFVGFWEGFNGGGATAATSGLFARTGVQSLELSIANTPNTFAGAFQDIPSLTAGTEYTFGGWHLTPSSPLSLGVELRIEWRNSVSNTEVGRTPNSTPVPTASWAPWSLTASVPAGADTARLVYAVQSFSTSPLGNGIVYVDDVYMVPEPSTVALAALAGAALVLRRRRA